MLLLQDGRDMLAPSRVGDEACCGVDLGARAEAAKVQPKNVWAEAEPNFSWAEAGKCLSQPSRAGKILTL